MTSCRGRKGSREYTPQPLSTRPLLSYLHLPLAKLNQKPEGRSLLRSEMFSGMGLATQSKMKNGRDGRVWKGRACRASLPLSPGSLPSAFLLSPFLSGVKLLPLTSHAEQLSQFVVLTPLAPASFLPSGSHLLAQTAYQSISLNKDPKRNCAVKLLSNLFRLFFVCFTLTIKKKKEGVSRG